MTNSIAETEPRRQHCARRTRIAATAFAVITLVLLALAWWMIPRRLKPDEIVREPGVYLSPGSGYRLVVSESDHRTICIRREQTGTWEDVPDRVVRSLRGVALPIS